MHMAQTDPSARSLTLYYILPVTCRLVGSRDNADLHI